MRTGYSFIEEICNIGIQDSIFNCSSIDVRDDIDKIPPTSPERHAQSILTTTPSTNLPSIKQTGKKTKWVRVK